jgi:hypothetical protein
MARPEPLVGALVPDPAGVGVAGTAAVADEPIWAIGAGGGAGVEATAGAGVDGTFAGVELELEAAGAAGTAFGYSERLVEWCTTFRRRPFDYLLNHTDNKSLLLDLVGFDCVGIL